MRDKGYETFKPLRDQRAWKKNAAGGVVVRTKFNRLLCLTPLGSDIFLLCGGKKTTAEIVTSMKGKYPAVPGGEIDSEVYNFLSFMQSMGVLLINPDHF